MDPFLVGLKVPISVKAKNPCITRAHLINVSHGGTGIYGDEPIEAEALEIRCELQGAESALE